jgi:hypothetical protein
MMGARRVDGARAHPRISTSRMLTGSGSSVSFHSSGRSSRSYELTARVGGGVVRRRRLDTTHVHVPPPRIFQGTDPFVNDCIDQDHT